MYTIGYIKFLILPVHRKKDAFERKTERRMYIARIITNLIFVQI